MAPWKWAATGLVILGLTLLTFARIRSEREKQVAYARAMRFAAEAQVTSGFGPVAYQGDPADNGTTYLLKADEQEKWLREAKGLPFFPALSITLEENHRRAEAYSQYFDLLEKASHAKLLAPVDAKVQIFVGQILVESSERLRLRSELRAADGDWAG
ncbi:MAG: hypothetical protein ABUL72_01570, partial [Armatimonadota bacterium]